MLSKTKYPRRKVLRGLLGGATVGVTLPMLDCFLNDSGTALANDTPLPLCFGTWFFGLGYMPSRWVPAVVGAGYQMGADCDVLSPLKNKINVFSGFKCYLDGHSNVVHTSGPEVILSGGIPRGRDQNFASIDTLIADVIGTRTRFRSLEVSCIGVPQSYSRREGAAPNPAEVSPLKLYTRIFGPEFVNPNAADFKPDPYIMVRRSVLSVVSDERKDYMKGLGASDRARLDQYFSSVREIEQQLDLALKRPQPLEACTVPQQEEGMAPGSVITEVLANHKVFAGLLAHALACGQTQVVNVLFSQAVSNIRHEGSADTHHVLTHEEAVDPQLGYQPKVAWFSQRSSEGLFTFLSALESIQEGDKTLLDRCLIFGNTDVGLALNHSIDNPPMFTAGSAGGRLKTGIHYQVKGDPPTKVGLTIQQAMGLPSSSWGIKSNHTSSAISELLV